MKQYRRIGLGMMMALCFQTFDSLAAMPDQPALSNKIDSILAVYFPEQMDPGVAVLVSGPRGTTFSSRGSADLEAGVPLSQSSNFRMASVSKHFTAMAVYQLIETGGLTFDTQLGTLLPGLSQRYQEITVGQLLTHTSGILDYEGLIPRDRQEQVSDWDVLELIAGRDELYFEPGDKFRYSNTGFCLLSLMVEQVAGLPYAEFMKQHLFDPSGLQNTYMYDKAREMPKRAFGYHPLGSEFRFADQSITSATKGDGCVYTSVQDFAMWAQRILDGAAGTAYLNQLDNRKYPVRDDVFYSLGWFVAPATGEEGLRLFHSGETTGFRNIVYLDVKRQVSIAVFSNQDHSVGVSDVFESIRQLLQIPHPIPAGEALHPIALMDWLSETY